MAEDESDIPTMVQKVTYRDQILDVDIPTTTTIADLALTCAELIDAPPSKITLFITPKPGLLKHPFPAQKLTDILTPRTKIKLIGTPSKDVESLNDMAARVEGRRQARLKAKQEARTVKSTPNRDWKKVQEEATYTFHAIEPLKFLPDPEKSRRYLQRLANDPGIKASMRKHKFSVGLLTEMNPAEHTTHESKTLGLNRNAGEVIELRLRTDWYVGYRDYKVIRKTLCHELAHNVFGEHDRNFWDLTKQIEGEVERNDTRHGGHALTGDEFYNPEDAGEDEEHVDGGGWVGGEYVLGSGGSSSQATGLSRREIMANAALARLEKQRNVDREQQEDTSTERPS